MTRRERELEAQLRSLRELCGWQLAKIKRLQAKIAQLEKQLAEQRQPADMV